MPRKPLEPGDPVRVGRFELLGRLGEGGQGVVYLGRGSGLGEERLAVKVLRSSADAVVMERLAREMAAVNQVQPFVTARVIEASTDGERRYVVSEFIDGPSLQDRVASAGPLAEGELLRLAVGTATALTAIHGAGVVHRDFKPANVLLGPDGPRVVDFGIARLTDVVTITSGVIGTPSYLAPEQLEGGRATSAADVFAWAATMAYAATGRMAFSAETVPAVMQRILTAEPDLAGVPASLLPLLRQCLAKDPRQRPAARDVLLAIVDRSAAQQPGGASSPVIVGAAGLGAAGLGAAAAGTGLAARLAPGHPPTELSGPATPVEAGLSAALTADALSRDVTPSGATPPGGTAPFTTAPVTRPGPRLPPALRRRWPVVAAVGGAAAVALVVIAVLLAFRPSPSASPPAGSRSQAAVQGASHAASPPTAGGLQVPASFAGSWSGSARQSLVGDPELGTTGSVTVTLAAGSQTGDLQANECVNTLTLTRATATVLTFDEPANPACAPGTVTLTLKGSSLVYSWTDGTEQNVGDLQKTG